MSIDVEIAVANVVTEDNNDVRLFGKFLGSVYCNDDAKDEMSKPRHYEARDGRRSSHARANFDEVKEVDQYLFKTSAACSINYKPFPPFEQAQQDGLGEQLGLQQGKASRSCVGTI